MFTTLLPSRIVTRRRDEDEVRSRTATSDGPTLFATGAYTYDDSGNVWKIGPDFYRYDLANRLLEAHDRNYWQPDAETLAALRDAADALEDQMEGVAAQ